ncbi:nectin-1-like [Leucoraja erinacea]|uniref:nectin-1-like n=1 Tax=Leucoraja erinaceus TaxID=7782 RepID=UPI002456EE86|nr:nectin-1-like [Leucoraja erinacea]
MTVIPAEWAEISSEPNCILNYLPVVYRQPTESAALACTIVSKAARRRCLEPLDNLQMKLFALALLLPLAHGRSPIVKTTENLVAVLGENVTFTCTTHLKGILQVTWQKLNGQSEDNIATFIEGFGPKVFGSFTDRGSILPSNKQESALVLSGVRLEDEGCYQCVFTTFPNGSNIGKTCLTVLEKRSDEETQKNKTTVTNANVNFTCTTQLKNVQQVTWQKLNGQSKENIMKLNATLNIIELRNDRVAFIARSKHGYTIKLSAVKPEDEGCYQCVFNTSTIISITGKTCLTVTAHASQFTTPYFWIIIGLLAVPRVF